MTHHITLKPSGHAFTVESSETLLEAALRSGLNVKYNCGSGTCGECRARVVEGQVARTDFYDFPLRESEKLAGVGLLCRMYAASDMVIEAVEAHGSNEIPHQKLETRISRLERIGTSHMVLHLRTPRTRTLRFLAGQAARLTLPDGESRLLSLASCPCNGLNLQFHLAQRDETRFNRSLFSTVHVGDVVVVEGPTGDITLDEDNRSALVFVVEGTRFAAAKSLLEHAINLDWDNPIRLVWLAASAGDHYLDNYCRSWGDVLEDFSFSLVTDRAGLEGALGTVQKEIQGARYYLALAPHDSTRIASLLLERGESSTMIQRIEGGNGLDTMSLEST